jgi:leucyl-tRNA synthetase
LSIAKKAPSGNALQILKISAGFLPEAMSVHPFTGEDLPVWISEYVLAGYGTGAIMAVPAHDERDYAFAKHFGLKITEVVSPVEI